MFFGDTVLLAIVIVLVATAPDGGALGLLGELDELDGVELLDPHAATQAASAADAITTPRRADLLISPLDRKTGPA